MWCACSIGIALQWGQKLGPRVKIEQCSMMTGTLEMIEMLEMLEMLKAMSLKPNRMMI
jgi:hypothetical protein